MFVPECAGRIVAVNNGIDIDDFLSNTGGLPVLSPTMEQKRIVLTIGHGYRFWKGHDILLNAFARIRPGFPELALIIVGGGQASETRQLASDLGICDAVFFLTDVPHAQVSALLQRSDMYVLSSRWKKGVYGEGMPIALLEAAAAGKPVVATASCGVAEILTNYETGLLVPTEDADALAQAMVYVLEHPGEAREMARRLHQHVRGEFTWRRAHERYLELSHSELARYMGASLASQSNSH